MAQEYDYALMTQSLNIPDPEHLRRVDVAELMAKTLAPQARVLSNSVRTLDGGGWEVVSHDLTTHGNILIVTYLLRRPV